MKPECWIRLTTLSRAASSQPEPTYASFYDELRYQQTFEYFPLIFKCLHLRTILSFKTKKSYKH